MNPTDPTPRTATEALIAEIAPDVALVEAAIEKVADAPAGYVRQLVEHVRGFGGKRLRPAMVLLAGRAVDPNKTTEAHARLGAVVELIHTATLVHDDILDGAMIRRGRPTLHKMEGVEIAVLLGDFLLASAYAEAASLNDGMAAHYLAHVTRQVCQGEVLQVHERGNLDLDERTYFDIIEKKTAILYAASCRVGAYYSGGTEEQIAALEGFGLGLGSAFQIVDDVLDLVGDEKVVGKSLGTDLQRQKMTLPLIHFMQNGDRSVIAAGSVEAARKRAEQFVADACRRLDILPAGRDRTTLCRIGDYVLERKR